MHKRRRGQVVPHECTKVNILMDFEHDAGSVLSVAMTAAAAFWIDKAGG
jgi:hypothetical protein